MKKLLVLVCLTVLGLGVVLSWDRIGEISAQVVEYFALDPDLRPGFQGEFDEGDYLRRREEFIALLRGVDPERPASPTARVEAVEQMDKQEDALKQSARRGDGPSSILIGSAWTEIGPAPIPLGQTSGSRTNVSGRVSAIEIDPTDPNKVYVGTAQGGIYRSLNGGTTWTPIFDSAQTLAIGCLTLDAASGILWVGTGEANGSADSFAGVGIYRIENVNTTADLVGPINPIRNYNNASNVAVSSGFFTGRSVSKIVRVPGDPNTLFVGIAGGVIGLGGNPPFGNVLPPLGMRGMARLSNVTGPVAGITGTRLAVSTADTGQGLCAFDLPCTVNRNVNDLVLDPQDPTGNTLIVWMNGINVANDGGIYRSTNAMTAAPTFVQTLITTSTTTSNGRGELRALVHGGVTGLYVASGEPSTGGTLCNSATNFGALRRSDDGGQTWTAKLPGGGGFCAGQCFYNIGLDVLPGATASADKILLGGNVTSGACARQQSTSLNGATTAFTAHDSQTHADTHVIKFAPSDPNVVYRGDDGGIWKSIDGGNTFAPFNNTTFKATQFQSIAVHPTDPNFTIGGTQDNGTELYNSAGVWSHTQDGDGGFAMIDQSTPTTMYHTFFNQTSSQIGYERSTNSGASWTFLGCSNTATTNGIACSPATTTAVNFYCPTALGPGSPNNTVYIGTDRLLRSSTQGTANVTISQAPIQAGVPLSSIAISPQDDNYRFVGLNNGALWFTTTGSSVLTSLDPVGGATVIPDFYVSRIQFDPTNKDTAYIALGNFSGGTAANQSHVWKITNLSTTPVITASNGTGANVLPDVPVNGFVVDPVNGNFLYAGTDIGVFVSTDAGANWVPFGTGFPRVAVFDMAFVKGAHKLRIATHGRGMWEIPALKADTTLTGLTDTPDPTVFGESYTVGFTLTAIPAPAISPTGTVVVDDGTGSTCTATLPATSCVLASASPGTKTLTYTYSGDASNNSSTATSSHIVNKAVTATALTSFVNPTAFGQSTTFTATISVTAPGVGTPTGTITFKDNNVNIGSCPAQTVGANVATCVISTLSVGTHPITAVYNGDANFSVSTSNMLPQAVNKAVTTTAVTSTPNPSVWGQPVTMTATISVVAPGAGAPTGTVNFLDGGFPVPACQSRPVSLVGVEYQASCTTSALPVGGPRLMNAVYSGDGNFNGSNSPNGYTVTVNKADTSTALTSSVNPTVSGQSTTFTATISVTAPGAGTPTGTVTFKDNNVDIGTCAAQVVAANVATCAISSLSVGTHPVTAVYNGDGNFNASTSNMVNQVVGKSDTVTTVTAAPASPGTFGQSVTFTATVAVAPPGIGTPVGTVTFNIDGNVFCVNTPVSAGPVVTATCTLAGLPALGAGVRNVVALYSGNVNFNPSVGTLNYTVNKANTTTIITSDGPDPSLINQPYTVAWTVVPNPVQPGSGAPTGTVTVSDGAATCSAAVAVGSCNLISTSVGNKTLVATYSGDANFNTSVSVGAAHTVNVQITGTVRQAPALTPLAGVTISLSGCASASAVTNAAGVYSLAGPYTGTCTVTPAGSSFDPLSRTFSVANNVSGADFTKYNSPADIPRTLTLTNQWVVPGASGTMPVVLNSQDNETFISFSYTFDFNVFATPPMPVCGANAPSCTITTDTSVLGKVGVTIIPAGGAFSRPDGTPFDTAEVAGPKQIARINFQSLATNLPSAPVNFSASPVAQLTKDALGNPLLTNYVNGLIVFAQGLEGDVAGRNAGSGTVDSSDVVQMRRFITGIDTPVLTFNEFQRADTAPSATKGDGVIDAADVIQTRRYGAGLDIAPSAGGPGLLVPAVAPPPGLERLENSRELAVGSTTAATGNRVSIPVDIRVNGDEAALSFTLIYDETRLTNPTVALNNGGDGAMLTSNTKEPGVIRILIDRDSPFSTESRSALTLVNVSFDVAKGAPSGDTQIEIADGTISDLSANKLAARYIGGVITVFGPNPSDDGDGSKKTRRLRHEQMPDLIGMWISDTSFKIGLLSDNK